MLFYAKMQLSSNTIHEYANEYMHMLMYADIEECEQLKPCSHGCVNIVGSFRCSCPSGMSLSGDGRVCKGTFYVFTVA